MRIAFICQSYPPMVSGAAIAVRQLAEGLSAQGHIILVISAGDGSHAQNRRMGGIEHVMLRSYKNPMRVGQTFTLSTGKPVFEHLTRFKPHILHSQDPLWFGLTGLRAARTLALPALLTLHQIPPFVATYLPEIPELRSAIQKGLWAYGAWLLKQFDRVVAPSQTTAEMTYTHTGCRPDVISNGIDLSWFTPEPGRPDEREYLAHKYGFDTLRPTILHVGRLDADKNVEILIRSAARAMEQVDAQFLVIGDGCQRPALEQLCADLGNRDRSHFLGYVDQKGDLPALYRQATVFATSSEIETQGIVVLEALACGVPVVASRATCLHESVQEAVNGFLVQPGAIDEMGTRLAELLSHPGRVDEMGRTGREMMGRHSIHYTVQAYERLYLDLVQRNLPGVWQSDIFQRERSREIRSSDFM